jgi:hypothetical protein
MFANRISANPSLRNNPYAALGLKLLPALIDRMVDGYLTTQSIAVMTAEARPPARPGETVALGAGTSLRVHYAYVNLNWFRVTATNPATPDMPLEFELHRHGLFRWTLVRIALPPKAL